MTKAYSGSCYCGDIKLTLEGLPSFVFACHCQSCRKFSAGGFLAAANFSADQLYVEGETNSFTYNGGNAEVELHFCPTCGTHCFAFPKHYENAVAVRMGTLEHTEGFPPMKDIFHEGAHPWASRSTTTD